MTHLTVVPDPHPDEPERPLTVVPDPPKPPHAPDIVDAFRERNIAALHDLMYELSNPPTFLREWAK